MVKKRCENRCTIWVQFSGGENYGAKLLIIFIINYEVIICVTYIIFLAGGKIWCEINNKIIIELLLIM